MASTRPLISVLGSLNIDLVSYVPHHPLPGETLTASHFNVSAGGKGANQAVACAKLSRTSDLRSPSVDVRMIGAVGADAYGKVLTDSLESYGVDASDVIVSGSNGDDAGSSATGTATIVVDEGTGENRIILAPGANGSLKPDLFSTQIETKPSLLVVQLEVPLETVLQTLKIAKDIGVPALLNAAPAQELPAEAYNGLAHLVVNETETAMLVGVKETDLASNEVVEKAGVTLLARGVQNVVITLGAKGAFYTCVSGESGFVPALKVDVVDTTAAGDTFIGAYSVLVAETCAAGSSQGFDIDQAVRKGILASSKTVSKKGAQTSIPWKNDVGEIQRSRQV